MATSNPYGYVQRVSKGHVSARSYHLAGRTKVPEGIGKMGRKPRIGVNLNTIAGAVETAGVAAGATARHILHQRQAQSAKDFNDEPADRIAGSWGDGRVAKEPGGGWGPAPEMT